MSRRLVMYMAVLVAISVAVALLQFVDGYSTRTWIADHKYPLLMWRLGVYATTARVWWKLRFRIINREGSDTMSAASLRRAEIAALISIVLLEATNWLPLLGSLGNESK